MAPSDPEITPEAEELGDDPTLASESDPEPNVSYRGVIDIGGPEPKDER